MSEEYTVNPSITSGAKRYRLQPDRLRIDSEKDGSSRSIMLADVARVRLTLIQGQALCGLETRGGEKVSVSSRHFRGFGNFVDQHAEYTRFVRALHLALAEAAPNARFVAGSNLGVAAAVLIFALLGVFVGMILLGVALGKTPPLRTVAPTLGVLPIGIAIAAGFVKMGRARPYDPASPPDHLLP